MTIPPSSHPRWADLVCGRADCKLNFLAAKILLARLTRLTELDPSPERVQKCTEEIRELYASHSELTKTQQDLQQIFGQ